MKNKKLYGVFAVTLAVLVTGVFGCSKTTEDAKKDSQKVETVKKKKGYQAGTVNGSHYESAWLGLQFDAPDGYHMYTAEELKNGGEEAVDTDQAEKEKDLSLDMRASSEQNGSISISVIRNDEQGMTADDYAASVQKEMLDNDGSVMKYTDQGTVSTENLADEDYAHLKMEYTLEDLSMCNEMYFRMIDDCAVMIKMEYTPGDTKSRDQMYQAIRAYQS